MRWKRDGGKYGNLEMSLVYLFLEVVGWFLDERKKTYDSSSVLEILSQIGSSCCVRQFRVIAESAFLWASASFLSLSHRHCRCLWPPQKKVSRSVSNACHQLPWLTRAICERDVHRASNARHQGISSQSEYRRGMTWAILCITRIPLRCYIWDISCIPECSRNSITYLNCISTPGGVDVFSRRGTCMFTLKRNRCFFSTSNKTNGDFNFYFFLLDIRESITSELARFYRWKWVYTRLTTSMSTNSKYFAYQILKLFKVCMCN